ncbi:MAG: hypothetical protein KF784_05870 [Fimbriimonadaceae bacterium]|nr:hypothetical protein [Fimbriimonadaceae bacterium]
MALSKILDALFEHIIQKGADRTIGALRTRSKLTTFKIWKSSEEARVAFSAILSLEIDNHFLIVRNLHRPETFAPFGGVIKYFDSASSFLNSVEFRPHMLAPAGDAHNDLRGFLPRKHCSSLLHWYTLNNDREQGNDCIRRELKEELKEAEVSIQVPTNIRFKHVRTIFEGPMIPPGANYQQVRLFEVWSPIADKTNIKNFIEKLFSISDNSHIISVNSDDIRVGRSRDNHVIAPHCEYLMTSRKKLPESPMIR